MWFRHGKLHRDGGPAIERAEGGPNEWRCHGVLHRDGGSAIEYPDGRKEWYHSGKCHRADGPAIEYARGGHAWYINGREVTREDVANLQNRRRLKRQRQIQKEAAVMTTGTVRPIAPMRRIRFKHLNQVP